jgi:Ca-activated chloride channel family protein
VHELNAMLATCGEKLDTSKFDERLLKNLPVDIRVILTWDADNCDIDLWVVDPNGEQCDYSHQLTYIGGRMSRDFTRGYGPEEFMLKRALPGKYQIKANYYGNRQQILAGATTIQATLFTNFGKPNQQQQAITLRLKETKEVVDVGEFEFK